MITSFRLCLSILFLTSFLLLTSFVNAQQDRSYEVLGFSPTTLNKSLTAYTVTLAKIRNGEKSPSELLEPSLSNPYHITIRSNTRSGLIRVKNRYLDEDLTMHFNKVYRRYVDDDLHYMFETGDNNTASYTVIPNYNNILFLTFMNDRGNGVELSFTISRR